MSIHIAKFRERAHLPEGDLKEMTVGQTASLITQMAAYADEVFKGKSQGANKRALVQELSHNLLHEVSDMDVGTVIEGIVNFRKGKILPSDIKTKSAGAIWSWLCGSAKSSETEEETQNRMLSADQDNDQEPEHVSESVEEKDAVVLVEEKDEEDQSNHASPSVDEHVDEEDEEE